MISEDSRFDFLKFRSVIFRKSKPETRHSIVLKGPIASSRCPQHVRPTTTNRRVVLTRVRVRSTRKRVLLMYRSVERRTPRVIGSSDPQQCCRPFLRVSAGRRQPVAARVVHAPATGFLLSEPAAFLHLLLAFLRLFHCYCCCLKFFVASLLLFLVIFCFLCFCFLASFLNYPLFCFLTEFFLYLPTTDGWF
jgi:hypothetical protein